MAYFILKSGLFVHRIILSFAFLSFDIKTLIHSVSLTGIVQTAFAFCILSLFIQVRKSKKEAVNQNLYQSSNIKSVSSEVCKGVEINLFSTIAQDELRDAVKKFASDLVRHALLLKEKNDADQIQSSHIKRASNHLYYDKKRGKGNSNILCTIGGLFLGAVMSNLLSLLIDKAQIDSTGACFMIFFAVIGVSLIALGMYRR